MGQTTNPDARDQETGTWVFVLGAGCSKACGAPLMAEFMTRARELSRRPDCPFAEDYAATLRFHGECVRISYMLDRWWENIEELYTQAHLRELAGIKGAKKLCQSIACVLWDVYRQPGVSTKAYEGFAAFLCAHSAAWFQSGRPRPVVVTTNYDVHLEAEFLKGWQCNNGVPTGSGGRLWIHALIGYPGFKPAQTPYCVIPDILAECLGHRGWLMKIRGIPVEVIKLHGSVNWFGHRGQTECLGGELIPTGPTRLACQDPGFKEDLAGRTPRSPAIVPPMLGKVRQDKTISANWKRAIHALKCAREVFILGYSFPETDAFMTRLLAEGIRDNKQLESVTIVNPDPSDTWWQRVERMFARSWWANSTKRVNLPFESLYGSGHATQWLDAAIEGGRVVDPTTHLGEVLRCQEEAAQGQVRRLLQHLARPGLLSRR